MSPGWSGAALLWLGCAAPPSGPQPPPADPPTAAATAPPEWPDVVLPPAPPRAPGAGLRPPLVLLLSWDTTRNDALSCNSVAVPGGSPAGAAQPATPVADGLAARGVRFPWALAHAPTTLSSHASVMTGLDPHGHAVVRNGFPLGPAAPVLAERFAAAGWDALAVVGASVLDHTMGLDRGFAVYDDAVGTAVRRRFEDRADRVVERVLLQLDARGEDPDPVFLFVHFFDAHSPWTSAPPATQRALLGGRPRGLVGPDGDPGALLAPAVREGRASYEEAQAGRALYYAEVAWVDAQTGRLLAALDARGWGAERLVVLFGDHGEALETPAERPYGHGTDVDLNGIHVPLILAGTGRFALPAGAAPTGTVRLMDVGATVLGLAGLGATLGEGRDLAADWAAGAPASSAAALPSTPASFAEATKPVEHEDPVGWNNLPFDRSVALGGHLYRRFPLLGQAGVLTERSSGQAVVVDQGGRARELRQLLDAWDAAAPPHRSDVPDQATADGLRALGYLDGGAAP